MSSSNRRIPKLCRSGNYACVYREGQRIMLGKWESPESFLAYARFVADFDVVSEVAANVRERDRAEGKIV